MDGGYTPEIASSTAVWYHTGMSAIPLRWVLIQAPKGRFETQALLCTDVSTDPIQILRGFRLRWQVEVTWSGKDFGN